MTTDNYKYIIIGGGQAGASAVEGIREIDKNGPILLMGEEKHLPYERPPLTKKLWFGKMSEDQVFIHDTAYYKDNGVTLTPGVRAMRVDPNRKTVTDNSGRTYQYTKLLLATGGRPRKLRIQGGNLNGVCYYRNLDDYERIRSSVRDGVTATVIGGGFIGSELSAALAVNAVKVTMIFPELYPCARVFPEGLGRAIGAHFVEKGVEMLSGDKPISFSLVDGGYMVRTEGGKNIRSDMLIVGVGIAPEVDLALTAHVKTFNGVIVDEYLRTSEPDIYAAGDNANFPCKALKRSIRFEHWDNALSQGRHAGRNMAGPANHSSIYPTSFLISSNSAMKRSAMWMPLWIPWRIGRKRIARVLSIICGTIGSGV